MNLRRPLLLAALLSAHPALAGPAATSPANWASDAQLEGIVDLLDPDYQQRPIAVRRLPVKFAVTTVHGRGKRVVYSFEDPNCGYCRQLSDRLEAIGDLTVHTFVVTFLGEDSRLKADAVWCAKDRAAAWRRVMKQLSLPPARAGCRAPSEETMKLVGLLGVNLTPTLFFADGSRMNGVRSREEIEARLAAAAHPRTAQ